MTVGEAFNKSVAYYDEWIQQALPGYPEIFRVAVSLLPEGTGDGMTIVDLGAGTGLFSSHAIKRLPRARYILWDVAEDMLEVAKKRFSDRLGQFEFVVGDYRELGDLKNIDGVISSLSIHHLPHEDKQELFKQIHSALKPEGLFINIDQIAAESDTAAELYWSWWLQMLRQNKADEKRIQDSIDRRRQYDQDATLVQQLDWLKQAGFDHVDCIYKNYFVGVFMAVK